MRPSIMRNETVTLFLFTVRYPYGPGEQFLHAEIEALCKKFDYVVIQPMFSQGHIRTLPSNCEVKEPLWRDSSIALSKLRFYLSRLLRASVWTEAFKEALKARRAHALNLSTFRKILMWASYSNALSRAPAVLEAVHSTQGKRVAYSYWGHVPALARKALTSNGVPMAIRFHRVDLYDNANEGIKHWTSAAKYMPWFSGLSEEANLLIFISDHGKKYFKARWMPNCESKSQLIVSRLGTLDFGVGPTAGKNKFVVVSCSRITAVKRVDKIALLILELSRKMECEVEWHHIGDGDPQQSSLNEALQSLRAQGVEYRLWGQLNHAELVEFFKTFPVNLFVNLSLSEGVPVTIMEALSFGIPAVATDVGGVAEAVVNGESGLLVEANMAEKPNELADMIIGEFRGDGLLNLSRPRKFWRERFFARCNYESLAEHLYAIAR